MTDAFVHLHVHDYFSLLDGLGSPEEYAERVALLGQPALGLTDHGSLSGAYRHYKACISNGLKPIIGCEFYVAPESRHIKERVRWGNDQSPRGADISGSGAYTHLTVVAKDAEGLRNLFRLQASAYSEGFYRKPRIDAELLERHSQGLLVLSGCASSAISTRLRLGQQREADELMEFYRQTFRDDFYVEVMHHGIEWEFELNRQLLELAQRHSVEVVATNDVHYCTSEQTSVHDAFCCIQSNSTLAAPTFKFSGEGYFLRSRREMEAAGTAGGLPSVALDNTLAVAGRVGSYAEIFEVDEVRWPRYPVPDGWTAEEALRSLAEDGMAARMSGDLTEARRRLAYELDVICGMGYPDYFLVEADLISRWKAAGIRVGPGRGSVGGSLVAYSLGITDLEPLAHGLVFERFLNPSRASRPDIDTDIDERRRDEAIAIAREVYGADRVAHIGTFGTIGAKAALKDANRVLGGSYIEGARRSEMLPPPTFGRAPGLDQYTGPKDEVYDLAVGLYGRVRNEGVHAAGYVVSPVPLRDLVPLRRSKESDTSIIGLTDKEVEVLGLVKMDFLGLRNLSILEEALSNIQTPITLPTLPEECNDRRTYELLARGDTLAVFQLDGKGMRKLLQSLRPTQFNDISAVLALFRPGPMGANAHTEFAKRKNDRGGQWRPEWAIHPELEAPLREALSPTFGLIVFQEQVLEALKVVCGWSYSEAALLFDAMRKKNHEKMAATRPDYETAGTARGYSPECLRALWDVLVPFADYSFNRAHTAGYGLVAYWTAYLKANHPIEYMAAALSSVAEDKDRLPEYLAEVQRMGIPILPPDINSSGVSFSPSSAGIHYGIGAIKGVGEKAYEAIKKKRPYRDLHDFFTRADQKALNSGTFGALVRSGTLDSLNPYREELVAAAPALLNRAEVIRQEMRAGQWTLYRLRLDVGNSGLYSLPQRLQWEQETLSTVLSYASATLVPRKVVTEPELIWVRDVVARHPGRDRLWMRFGRAVVEVGSVDWSRVESAVGTLGIFDVE